MIFLLTTVIVGISLSVIAFCISLFSSGKAKAREKVAKMDNSTSLRNKAIVRTEKTMSDSSLSFFFLVRINDNSLKIYFCLFEKHYDKMYIFSAFLDTVKIRYR